MLFKQCLIITMYCSRLFLDSRKIHMLDTPTIQHDEFVNTTVNLSGERDTQRGVVTQTGTF